MHVAGHMLFHGPCKEVMPFFQGLGFDIPERKGIPDFLQEVSGLRDQEVLPRPRYQDFSDSMFLSDAWCRGCMLTALPACCHCSLADQGSCCASALRCCQGSPWEVKRVAPSLVHRCLQDTLVTCNISLCVYTKRDVSAGCNAPLASCSSLDDMKASSAWMQTRTGRQPRDCWTARTTDWLLLHRPTGAGTSPTALCQSQRLQRPSATPRWARPMQPTWTSLSRRRRSATRPWSPSAMLSPVGSSACGSHGCRLLLKPPMFTESCMLSNEWHAACRGTLILRGPLVSSLAWCLHDHSVPHCISLVVCWYMVPGMQPICCR